MSALCSTSGKCRFIFFRPFLGFISSLDTGDEVVQISFYVALKVTPVLYRERSPDRTWTDSDESGDSFDESV